ncbi:MAG TPA: four helix bundle protein [Terriglobia bacterium]|nr:four helix bundle protein [Terriglobia bacterium]
MQGYRDLLVWQKSMDLVTRVYRITRTFPKSEVYGLGSQMQRAAVSVPKS